MNDLASNKIKNLMKPLFILLLFPLFSLGQEFYGAIDSNLLKAVVHVRNSHGHGTGFIVSAKDGKRWFLVTNKHMVGSWTPCEFHPYDSITITFYSNGPKHFLDRNLNLFRESQSQPRNIIFHPQPYVDIAALEITKEIRSIPNIDLKYFDTSLLKPMDSLSHFAIGIGDPIFALGYPSGIHPLQTYLPIAKSGYIATTISEDNEFIVALPSDSGRDTCISRIRGKMFLVDGLIIKGNSGGPIVLARPVSPFYAGGNLIVEETRVKENYVLGIVSIGYDNTGINIIYSSSYIKELINGLYHRP
jgi:Trypsin-like peptidase domain